MVKLALWDKPGPSERVTLTSPTFFFFSNFPFPQVIPNISFLRLVIYPGQQLGSTEANVERQFQVGAQLPR